ncbi:MAG: recombinase family protein [bacterium]
MSKTYAYLRVSTLIQDTEKNKGDILRFANDKKLGNVEFIEETVTGTSNYKDRLLGSLICDLKSGDVLIVPELSRLARSISQILEIIDLSKQKNFTLYSLKENFCSDDKSITSVITSTIFGLVAQIERDLISQRTKEALRAKKEAGMMLGRPKGRGKSKLDIHKEEIEAMIKTGVPKTKIAKKYGTLPYNLYNWLKMNEIDYKELV